MAFSTSISLFLMATVFCLIVNAAPSLVDRQSKQIYVIPPVNYYNPIVGQILIPSAASQGEFDAKFSEEESEVTGRQSSETLSISPVDTECKKGEVKDNGYGGCAKGSQAPSGNIVVKFSAIGQVVVVALVPNPRRYSKVKLTCSEVTKAAVFTKSAKIAATTDSPVTETKQTQVVIASEDAASKVSCSWEAS